LLPAIAKILFCFLSQYIIYTAIDFTRLSVTTEVGALYGRLICGWLGVVWEWSTRATVSSARGWLGVVVARQAHLSGWLGVIVARKADLS